MKLCNIIYNNRLNFIFHIKRAELVSIPKQVTRCTPRGTNCVGLQKLHWLNQPTVLKDGTDREVQMLMILMSCHLALQSGILSMSVRTQQV
jgi:hypothetical protein